VRVEVKRRLEVLLGGRAQLGSPDAILALAKARGLTPAVDEVGEITVLDEVLARRILRGMWTLDGDVYVVTHRMRCHRVAASQLVDFVLRQYELVGEHAFEGDELVIGVTAPRVLVWHHEGWVFDLEL
jgi:hypothetical protein